MTNHPRDLNQLMEALTRNGSDNPATSHTLVSCAEVIVRNLAGIHEQLRVANLLALAAHHDHQDPLCDAANQALDTLLGSLTTTHIDYDGVPTEEEYLPCAPDIAAALGIDTQETRQ